MDFYFVGYNTLLAKIISEREIPIAFNVLISMMEMNPRIAGQLYQAKESGHIKKMALDSGTFGLQKPNPPYDAHTLFHRLIEFAKGNSDLCDLIFNFDLNFTSIGFEENYDYLMQLCAAGIDAIPVTHDILNREYGRFIAAGFTKIAIGQDANRKNVELLRERVVDMTMSGVSHIHLLGVGTPEKLLSIPIGSCDASSYIQYAKFGIVNYWDNQLDSNNKSQQFTVPIYKDTVQKSPNGGRSIGEHKERLLRILTDWGIDISWNDLLSESSVFFIELINMLYYLEVERACTEMHNQLWKKALSPEEY